MIHPRLPNTLAIFLLLVVSLVSTNACDDLKCANGGTCYKEKDGSTVHEFCLCPAEFEGEKCERKKVCNLSCANGECRFPYVPPSGRKEIEVNSEPYCFCNKGYSGVYCESPIVTCPDGKRTCYNGAKCEEVFHPDGRAFLTPRYKCNCEGAGDPRNPYAGLNCHLPAEKVCSLMTEEIKSFCVNGGTCKDMTTTEGAHFGCHCPDNFEGEHCEYLKGTDPDKQSVEEPLNSNESTLTQEVKKQTSSKGSTALKNLAIIGIIVGVFGIFWIVNTTRSINRKRKALQEAASAYIDDDVAFDADGNRMTNISIGDDDDEDFDDCQGKII